MNVNFSKKTIIVATAALLLAAALTGAAGVYLHADASEKASVPVVFQEVVQRDTLVTASQDYCITEKEEDTLTFFDMCDIPFTKNSYWYQFCGTVSAGVDLGTAELLAYDQDARTVSISMESPRIISNDPDEESSCVLEENNNVFNPIHVEDTDAFLERCEQRSNETVLEGGLLDRAKNYAEDDLSDLYSAGLGANYAVVFRQADFS